MRSCPHHDISRWQLVKLFFDGVDATNQAMINASSSGTFMWQEPEDAWRFLEQLSNGSKANFSTRKPVSTAAAVGTDNEWRKEVKKEIRELNRKFDRLMVTLQNGPQNLQQQGSHQGQRPYNQGS